jgi:hypothetical protein
VLEVRVESQQNTVADEVAALTAVVRPILEGVLRALKADIVKEAGGYQKVKLKLLPRMYRQGDGDCGICFEYAVHDAMNRADSSVLERVEDALKTHCRITGVAPSSILFGAEKSGAVQLIETVKDRLTDESALLGGARGRPVKLKRHIDTVTTAFRRPNARLNLPQSISGLWKADLFLGMGDADRWVGTTVKINVNQLEAAKGLRVGIVPTKQGKSDKVFKDEQRNLVICPLPHDADFMEVFYQGWGIVQQFIAADANVPKEVALPRAPERQVAKYLADRREFAVVEVIDALKPLAQPELLITKAHDATLVAHREGEATTRAVLAPKSKRP